MGLVKKKLIPLLLLILISSLVFIYLLNRFNQYRFFSVDCSIYNKYSKIIFYNKNVLCAFADDGKILVSNPTANSLKMFDKNDNLLWSSVEQAHHDLKFTENQEFFLAITSEVIYYKNEKVRSDCVSKRNLGNQTIMQWCLGNHINELDVLGYNFNPIPGDKYSVNNLIDAPLEISHLNSIYEIKKNSLSEVYPAFKEGNFIVNLFLPSMALIILDNEMKNILWQKNLSKFTYGVNELMLISHDQQVSDDGWILSYINGFTEKQQNYLNLQSQTENKIEYSNILKWHPYSGAIKWIYSSTPKEKFFSPILGSVTELKNKNYLISDITSENLVFEVDPQKKIIWSQKINQQYNIRKVKPIYNTSFLKSRGLLD